MRRQRIKNVCLSLLGLALVSVIGTVATAESIRYQAQDDFLREVLGAEHPASDVVWINDELRQLAVRILGHKTDSLRMRYWYEGDRTVWIINEIGKEKPITLGIVVENQKVVLLRVLEFRESRGWEISYPFFTRQFAGLSLDASGKLDKRIDGISGATLSVKAATRSANFVLILDQYAARKKQAIVSAP